MRIVFKILGVIFFFLLFMIIVLWVQIASWCVQDHKAIEDMELRELRQRQCFYNLEVMKGEK